MSTDSKERIARAGAQLKTALLAHMAGDGVYPTAIPGVYMARRDHAGISEHRFDQPLASLLVQGSKKTLFGSEEHTLTENQVLLVGMDMPSSSQILEASPEKPLLTLFFHINRQIVGDLILQLGWKERRDAHAPGISVADAGPDLMETFARLTHILARPEQIPVRGELALRDLHYLLLAGPQADVLHAVYGSSRHGRQLFAAIDYLRAHLDAPVSLAELARAVYMSESTLYRSFRTLTGLSPMQYYKQLRLHEARRLILEENEQAVQAAARVGYGSAQQFNRDYKRLFGQPPRKSKQYR
ncbi:AraC family transcriptional regulator [Desulfovibrio sp.]|uniref:AraC family transcriptional regulator n=1 Tax=Desulfovibrio sp. TaxID=885 RepID=UPI0023C1A68B|nr:AraC family transcriptional regulator [Desulfovibrio sp.]MDE7242178.1 AraC family transcriptional regulator [Desulfovibrio sp.]